MIDAERNRAVPRVFCYRGQECGWHSVTDRCGYCCVLLVVAMQQMCQLIAMVA